MLFPTEGRPEVKLAADQRTTGFDVHASMEEVLDSYERIRLHYVAATRARDHLVVSAHHKSSGRNSIGRRTWEAAELCPDLWTSFSAVGDEHYDAQPPTQLRLAGGGYVNELEEWTAIQNQIAESSQAARHWSATSVAQAHGDNDSAFLEVTRRVDAAASWRADGAGAAVGSAVHAALEFVNFDGGEDLAALAKSCATTFGVSELSQEVLARLEAALASPTLELARKTKSWRELYVAAPTGSGVVEGFVDLCIETDDGLVVVDYKTDELVGPNAVAEKVDRYRLQGATYAVALEHVTQMAVIECRFLFLGADDVIEASIEDLDSATAEVRQFLAMTSSS